MVELNHAEDTLGSADVNVPGACPNSSVSWRPAEDVLPTEPDLEIAQDHPPTLVYSRRRRGLRNPAFATPSPAPATSPPSLDVQASEEFTNRISKTLHPAVPVPGPAVQRRGRLADPATQAPRRSRRVAKLPPEIIYHPAAAVCRCLGFTDETSRVTEEVKEKCTQFFKKPLVRRHVVAMATLLGKEVPDDTRVLTGRVEVVV